MTGRIIEKTSSAAEPVEMTATTLRAAVSSFPRKTCDEAIPAAVVTTIPRTATMMSGTGLTGLHELKTPSEPI